MTDPNTTTPATLRADALELLREIAARKRYDPNAKVPWANNSGSITINLKSELLARVDALLDAPPAAPAAPVEDVAPNVVEAIAEQWDGCMYAAPGIDIDIGEAIRAAAKRLDAARAAQTVAADGSAIDTKAIADSLERMIVDWYADCERTRLDWKQMAGVIKLRLDRFLKRAAVSPATAADMSDAYVGAREDLAIWKRRALEAEGKVEQLADARKLVAHASEFAMMQLDEDWHERAAALLALPAPAVSASAPPAHCQCPACSGGTTHASDCAVHNEPAMLQGPCDCAAGRGLYRKFDVRRLDGSSAPGGKHHGCEYFVLDLQHDAHAGAALAAYARSCSTTHPALSADLLARAAALGATVAVDEWVSKADALPAVPGWYLVMLAPDNDWELMSDTPIQVEFGAYKHMPQAFTHFYDGRPDADITEAVTFWTRLPAPPRPAPSAAPDAAAISESEWQPIETAPKDGTAVALLFAEEVTVLGKLRPRVRAASWLGDWTIPYRRDNPPIGWMHMPAAPIDAARKGEKS
ncbi:hypothetical protein [Burkholderia gladioli]|uniref:hypothetical protein n=1 Tax=Burkholderia gladioli TaxID=28095 RepID=UPI003017AAE1